MGTKPKTKFVTETGGYLRELFSVRDSAVDGSINIFVPETQFARAPDGTVRRSYERRYSVHPSPNTHGTTIKETWVQEGHRMETMNFVSNTKTGLLSPIWGALQWRYEPHEICQPRSKDTVKQILAFDQNANTLIYQVMVYDRDTVPVPDGSPVWMAWAPFRKFNIAIYYTFMPVRAISEGRRYYFATSTPRINGGEYSWKNPNSPSFQIDEIPGIMGELMNMARDDYLAIARNVLGDVPHYHRLAAASARFGLMVWPHHSVQL